MSDPTEEGRLVACIYCGESIILPARKHNERKHPMAICVAEGARTSARAAARCLLGPVM